MTQRFRAETLAGIPRVIDTALGATARTVKGDPAFFRTFAEAQAFARGENAAESRDTDVKVEPAADVIRVYPESAPTLHHGYRLADTSVEDMAYLARLAQVLVHDRDWGVVRKARVRKLASDSMSVTVGDDSIMLSPIDDDPDPLAYRHFTDADRRFWLLMVTR